MQAEQTRAVIIAAASRVFSERGWMATNVRDVAREAGVSVETLYSSFGSKAELLKVALDVAIVGARQAGHVEDSLAAADVSLSDADLDEIDKIMSSAAPVAGPSPEGM